jgi:hypothetical protein
MSTESLVNMGELHPSTFVGDLANWRWRLKGSSPEGSAFVNKCQRVILPLFQLMTHTSNLSSGAMQKLCHW